MTKAFILILACLLLFTTTCLAEGATITTLGTARISAVPDQAMITLGVRTEDVDVATAQQKNAETLEKVLAALKEAGATQDEMRTSYFNIEPVYDYSNNGGAKIRGYALNNALAITTGNLDKLGEWISVAIAAGANVGYGPEFTLKDSSPVFNEALKKAIINARGRAVALAEQEGSTVGDAQSIIQAGAQVTPIEAKYANSYVGAGGPTMDASYTSQIIPGSISIEANVQITFELKK